MRIAAYLINLDRDTDRREHMRVQLGTAGVPFERFPAIHGIAVPDWLRPWFFEADGAPVASLKPGEIGVYASHLSLHRQLLADEGADAYLVMEDDLAIAGDLAPLLAALTARAPEFDLIRLSNPAKAPYLDHGEVSPGRALVTYSRVPNNMGAYLISRAGAGKTTRFRGIRRFAIDEDMRRPWDWSIETFGILPAPVRANIFETSSIDAMGDRGLGAESFLAKLRRRRIGTPADWARQIAWQARQFGLVGYLSAMARGALHSVLKRLGFMTTARAFRLLRIASKDRPR